MSILGSLIVSLEARTASFIDGLNAAAKTSRTVGREIENSFSEVGDLAGRALAPFGEFGAAIAEIFARVGESAGEAIQTFGKMGGALGGISAAAAGATAALSAVSLGAIALAAHTAESIAKIGELSQSSGISVEALSGLGFAGKQVGLSIESVAGALEKMDKSVLKAATSPVGATTAFSRLQISLRDSSGQIKPTEELFADLAGRFASMPDGITKTALAMQVFGKGGAEMIPLLNKGKEGIDEMISTAGALGIVLDEQTVKGAEQFKESLATIEEAGQGLAIHLTKDLLPALQTVTDFLVAGLKDKNSGLNELVDGVATATKVFLTLGEVVYKVFQQIGVFVGNTIAALVEFGSAAYNAIARATHFDWSGVVSAWQEGNRRISAVDAQGAADSKKLWGEAAGFIKGVWSQPQPQSGITRRTGTTVDTSAKADPALEAIRARIAALQQEQAGWLRISSAGTQAEQLIAEAVKKGNDEFGKLKESAAKDKNDPASALALVLKNEGLIKAAEASGVYGGAIRSLIGDLDKEGQKLSEQDKSVQALGAAYLQGGAAIARAAIDKQFSAEAAKIQVLKDAYGLLAREPEKNAAAMKQFSDAIAVASKALEDNKAKASAIASDQLTSDLNRDSQAFQDSAQYVDNLSNAYLRGSDAVRAARIELELFRFKQDQLSKGVVVTPAQEQQKRTTLTNQDDQAYQATVKQMAAQYDLNALYDAEIVKLQRVRQVLQDAGESTLLIDARLFAAQNSLIHQWDDAAFAVGSFGQKFHGVLNELVVQGQEAAAAIPKAFVTAIDSVETQLAKLLTGQKTNFKQVATGLAETIAKSEIQQTVGKIAGKLGIDTSAFEGKPDGSANHPLYVVLVGGNTPRLPGGLNTPGTSVGGPGGASSGGIGGLFNSIIKHFGFGGGASTGGGGGGRAGGALGGIFTDFAGGLANKFISSEIASLAASQAASSAATTLGGAGSLPGGGVGFGIGSDIGDVLPNFGGFAATGADVSPGKLYRVNERNEEYFMPHVSGRVSPAPRASGKSGHTINQTINLNYPEKPDLFKKSNEQMTRDVHRQTSIALSR